MITRLLLALIAAAGICPSSAVAADAQSLAEQNNRFALELYSKLSGAPGNIFVSPYSISSAMAMVYEGAKAETAQEIGAALHFDGDAAARRAGWAESVRTINTPSENYALSTANALWAQKDFTFSQEYLAAVEQYYGGAAKNLDFVARAEESRSEINRWVEERTKDRIKDLIPPGALTDLTRLVITNAVYFKGSWVTPFDKEATHDEVFFPAAGPAGKAHLMSLAGEKATFPYAETDGVQAVALPYKGERLELVALLPSDKNIAALERRLTPALYAKIVHAMTSQQIVLYLPRFKVEAKYFMRPTLEALGLKRSFDPALADFSGMTGKRELYISEVIHQSFVEVNELGTEAAAATAIIMRAGAAYHEPKPVPVFRADRPFLYFIVEKGTGAILFMGRLSQPME